MGILDFVKSGVQRMMITRDDAHKDKVVFKHPDQTFPFWSQLTVDADEVCLFFKDGQHVGTLGPGRHTLQTQNIPFLNALVDKFTGGDVFVSELFFVTVRPLYNQGFGDALGSMRDPELELRVTPRAFGTFAYRVVDPIRFVIGFVGQTGAQDPERAMRWVRDQLFMGLRSVLTRLIKSGELTFMDLGTAGPDVARAIVQDCPDLANVGVQVLEIGKLSINLSDEDQARIDEVQDQIVQAKMAARVARAGIARSEAEAQARQFELDQQFLNRARYVNQMDVGRYREYAAAEATLGMGQGMQKGAEGAALGMMTAGMAAGAGLGAGLMQGARPNPYPAPGYGAPYGAPGYGQPYAPPGYPPPGMAPPVPPGYPPQGYAPPAPGEDVMGAAPAGGASQGLASPLNCGGCGTATAPGARFCAACGRPQG